MIVEQRSQEWIEMRKGRITSSEIYKIMGKDNFSETAKTYLLEKVCELYGGVTEPATGAALTWGTDLEPVAIEHYEKLTKSKVEKSSIERSSKSSICVFCLNKYIIQDITVIA